MANGSRPPKCTIMSFEHNVVSWFTNAIKTIIDLLDNNGNILNLNNINEKYKVDHIGFLTYYRLETHTEKSILPIKLDKNTLRNIVQKYSFNLKKLYNHQKGVKIFYNIFDRNQPKPYTNYKFNNDLPIYLDNSTWEQSFKIRFKTIKTTITDDYCLKY